MTILTLATISEKQSQFPGPTPAGWIWNPSASMDYTALSRRKIGAHKALPGDVKKVLTGEDPG